MEYLKRLEPMWLLLIILAALNWAVIALFDTNLITEAFGTGTLKDVVYCVAGFGALMLVPRLMTELRMDLGEHRIHPRGV